MWLTDPLDGNRNLLARVGSAELATVREALERAAQQLSCGGRVVLEFWEEARRYWDGSNAENYASAEHRGDAACGMASARQLLEHSAPSAKPGSIQAAPDFAEKYLDRLEGTWQDLSGNEFMVIRDAATCVAQVGDTTCTIHAAPGDGGTCRILLCAGETCDAYWRMDGNRCTKTSVVWTPLTPLPTAPTFVPPFAFEWKRQGRYRWQGQPAHIALRVTDAAPCKPNDSIVAAIAAALMRTSRDPVAEVLPTNLWRCYVRALASGTPAPEAISPEELGESRSSSGKGTRSSADPNYPRIANLRLFLCRGQLVSTSIHHSLPILLRHESFEAGVQHL